MSIPTMMSSKAVSYALVTASVLAVAAAQQCLSDSTIESAITGTLDGPEADSCCQQHICGLPCPEEVPSPTSGFAIAVGVSIAISFIVGMLTIFFVKGESENFFVAGRSLPLWVVSITLAAQAIDANGLLGNADLSYKFHFWDGAALPIGIGLSLYLNALFLAHHVNNDMVMTLPDIFAKRYGKTVEILVSICTIISFVVLLAGNLVGLANILQYVWGIEQKGAVWLSAAIVWGYTVTGGLFSVAYTDIVQGLTGFSGCFVCALYLISNEETSAPQPSVGFPSYVYPDDDTCAMYNGVPCTFIEGACCYNNATEFADNGAYPFGDQRVFSNQMTSPTALTPFPNAIFWNWCTIFILAFGNLAALDFQARCMASKTPTIARLGCLVGGTLTFIIGVPFSYLGAITRVYYGPDSVHADFTADTCSEILGLPTCAQWNPDPLAFIKLLTHQAPPVLGAWCLLGIVSASMSTADGAILAMGTVFSHNLLRQLDSFYPGLVTDKTLLLACRLSTIPFALAATLIASYYSNTGYLLIVAFDIVLATVVAPLFGCFYAKNPSPRAAFLSVVSGAFLRILLEFVLPKDGFLLLPFNYPEFEDFGSAASAGLPVFFDAAAEDLWDPVAEPCVQELFEDYTGVDSMASFLVSIIVFLTVQYLEHTMQRPLFSFPGDVPYDKNEDGKVVDVTEGVKEVEPSTEYVEGKQEEPASSPDTPSHIDDAPEVEC